MQRNISAKISPLLRDLQVIKAFEHMQKVQEARIIAPDIIEWLEDMQSEIVALRHCVASLINQNVRKELKAKEKPATKDNAKAEE